MKKKQNQGLVVGIDAGTTISATAVLESDGSTKIVSNLDGEPLTPSVVNLGDEGKPIVGRAAVNQMAFDPTRTARLFKRGMGKRDASGAPIPAFVHPESGKAYAPEFLTSLVIRFLVASAAASLGKKVVGVVISVPAYFDSDAREATRRAGELAGVNVLGIVNEPTAAGIAYGLDQGHSGTYVFYDLGGGTFDVTILEINGDRFEVRATDGDRDLGGSDIDNLIAADVATAFKAEHGVVISPESDLITWVDLLTKCENAKKTLSQADVANFMIATQGQRLIVELTRAQLNALIAPIVQKTKAITERALAVAGLASKQIKDVILVGGSTRIPACREMLREVFGKPPRTDINPDEAVARGAAIIAAKHAVDAGLAVVDSQDQAVLPPPIQVSEVTSQSLGCLALVNGTERNSVIIPANTKLPVEIEKPFGLVFENQTAARVTITSGAHHAAPADCQRYGEVILAELPPRALGSEDIRVKYGFGADGRLHVTITDLLSGKSTSELKRGLEGMVGKVA